VNPLRQGVQRFNRRAMRGPSPADKVVLVFLAVALPVWLGIERGPAVGILAAIVYGLLFLTGVFDHRVLIAVSRRFPYLDLLMFPALAFLALAAISEWPLLVCAAISAGAGLLFAVVITILRRRRQASPT
jgi:hypothetical protein